MPVFPQLLDQKVCMGAGLHVLSSQAHNNDL
jgi:hypothetical protein